MKVFCLALAVCLATGIAGCKMSNPYIMKVDRTDQSVVGNRGYIKGTPPPAEERVGLKRPLITVDVDIPDVDDRPTRFVSSKAKTAAKKEDIK